MNSSALRIGEVALRAGVSIDTVRYYERRRLLPAAARSEGGFRLFTPDAVDRVRFIKQAQELGFSLDEIGELLATGGAEECRRVRDQRCDHDAFNIHSARSTLQPADAPQETRLPHYCDADTGLRDRRQHDDLHLDQGGALATLARHQAPGGSGRDLGRQPRSGAPHATTLPFHRRTSITWTSATETKSSPARSRETNRQTPSVSRTFLMMRTCFFAAIDYLQ
jgi:DNA-binding transcriptional MerR regulator